MLCMPSCLWSLVLVLPRVSLILMLVQADKLIAIFNWLWKVCVEESIWMLQMPAAEITTWFVLILQEAARYFTVNLMHLWWEKWPHIGGLGSFFFWSESCFLLRLKSWVSFPFQCYEEVWICWSHKCWYQFVLLFFSPSFPQELHFFPWQKLSAE